MKKILLSVGLTVVFAFFAVYQRLNGSSAITYVAPSPIAENVIDTPTPTPETSSGPSPEPTRLPTPTTRPTVAPTPVSTPRPTPTPNQGQYRNGSYTGNVADAYYGNVQVRAIISGGQINDVQFLDYPQDRGHSISINNYAMPRLISETIQVQNANVDTISGATATSGAFRESLGNALAQARN